MTAGPEEDRVAGERGTAATVATERSEVSSTSWDGTLQGLRTKVPELQSWLPSV